MDAARKRWKVWHRQQRIMAREIGLALQDSLIYGTGFVRNVPPEDGFVVRVPPFEEKSRIERMLGEVGSNMPLWRVR